MKLRPTIFLSGVSSEFGSFRDAVEVEVQKKGLEPLQYAPTSTTPGELKDAGIAALLKGLAAHSGGLCIVTTRYSLPNLKAFWQTTAPEIAITRLSQAAGVHLLKTLGVKGLAKEFETLVEDVKGHALTLNLLGTYLRDAHGGDIRRRDLIKLEEADAEEQGGHAFRAIEAYERAFENDGVQGNRALAILRLLGLFDRPIAGDCLTALLEKPVIDGLTQRLVELSDAQRNLTFKRLADAKLLTVNRDASATLVALDAHPLIREYFALQLRTTQPYTWRAAHRRLFEYLCATTDKPQPTLEDLQPLYQAVAHGCQAELYQAAFAVYAQRIIRNDLYYSTRQLGAFASDLGALACFFDVPWTQVSSVFSEADQAWLLNLAATRLRPLGRLSEAIEPTLAAVELSVTREFWKPAAADALNLSELNLILGKVSEAVQCGEQSVKYADIDGDISTRIISRTAHADALHQAGHQPAAEARFREAEQMNVERGSPYPLLPSVQGFQYCDLLLATSERTAWQYTLEGGNKPLDCRVLHIIFQRAKQTLTWARNLGSSFLDIALHQLTLCRAALYHKLLSDTADMGNIDDSAAFDSAVRWLRDSNYQDELPKGLLSRAWYRFLTTGANSAQEDLDEAWEIAERGPMRLFMADIHLYRARLFFREEEYPWESPEADLAAARKQIEQCGYWRRKEELEDAERVILKKSA